MAAFNRVLPVDEFDREVKRYAEVDPNEPPEVRGEFYWKNKFGCRSCHSIDGSASTGPTWLDLYGRTETFRDGTTIDLSDDVEFANYVRQSVYEPNARIVSGFTPQMNSYQGQVKEEQLADLIAFMKSPKVAPQMAAKRAAEGGAPATPDAKPPDTPPATPPSPGGN
jgi:cytochrome c oxidase subunit 2